MSHHNNNNNQKPKAFPESFPGDLFPPDISGETSAFTVPKNDPFSKCVTVYGDGCQPARQSSWGCAVPKEFSASSRFRPDQPVQVPRPFPGHVPQTGPVTQVPNPVPGPRPVPVPIPVLEPQEKEPAKDSNPAKVNSPILSSSDNDSTATNKTDDVLEDLLAQCSHQDLIKQYKILFRSFHQLKDLVDEHCEDIVKCYGCDDHLHVENGNLCDGCEETFCSRHPVYNILKFTLCQNCALANIPEDVKQLIRQPNFECLLEPKRNPGSIF